MKPAAFEYVRADSIDHAVELLGSTHDTSKLLAGGQSLGPMLNLRLTRPKRLVDLKRAAGIRACAADEKVFSIGAGWTHAEIEDGVIEDPTHGLMRFVARGIAYRAVRNRGTIGGSLAHADPAADWVAAMAGLGATIVMQGRGRQLRRVAAMDFVLGAFATALEAEEVLAAVELPQLSPASRWGYCKLCRKTGEFAMAIGIAVLDPARGLARVVCGATDGPPLLLAAASHSLIDAGPDQAIAVAAEELSAGLPRIDPIGLQLHRVAVQRALKQLAEPKSP